MEEKINLENSSGHKLVGVLLTPEKTSKIMILSHGLNSHKDSNTNTALSKILLEHNIATFRFDFFAHGESEGNIEDRTLERFVDDLIIVINLVKKKGFTDVGLMGSSFGGITSVIAASKSKEIKLLVLKASGMGQTSRKMPNYMHNFETKSWIKAGEKINIPTLILHGTADIDVEFELGKQLHKAIKTSKMLTYDGADHRFTRKEDFDKSIIDITTFILEHLNQ